MPPLKDLTGQKFGKITVIKRAPDKNKKVQWTCQCECGNIKDIASRHLVSGAVVSCGECHVRDIIGHTYNNWLVKDVIKAHRKGDRLYECECMKCHNIAYKTKNDLYKHVQQKSITCRLCDQGDLTNKTFGLLTVLGKNKDIIDNRTSHWNTKCICGIELIVAYGDLVNQHIGSCKNCKRKSRGEGKIEQILLNNHIQFETQKSFPSCRFKDTGHLARFDFYLPKYNVIIEYDGEQHFKSNKTGWYTKDYFLARAKKDKYKTEWCQENNIHLIRIPYTKYDELSIEMIKELIQEKN